jgi:hypothetical protein
MCISHADKISITCTYSCIKKNANFLKQLLHFVLLLQQREEKAKSRIYTWDRLRHLFNLNIIFIQ